MLVNIAFKGSPIFVNTSEVAAIRPARQGEAGASIVILSGGNELGSHYGVIDIAERLRGAGLPSQWREGESAIV